MAAEEGERERESVCVCVCVCVRVRVRDSTWCFGAGAVVDLLSLAGSYAGYAVLGEDRKSSWVCLGACGERDRK
jgi:hypothetical protein